MFEDEACEKSENKSEGERHDSEHEKLAYDLKRRGCSKVSRLKLNHGVKQNNRDDVVEHALSEDATV